MWSLWISPSTIWLLYMYVCMYVHSNIALSLSDFHFNPANPPVHPAVTGEWMFFIHEQWSGWVSGCPYYSVQAGWSVLPWVVASPVLSLFACLPVSENWAAWLCQVSRSIELVCTDERYAYTYIRIRICYALAHFILLLTASRLRYVAHPVKKTLARALNATLYIHATSCTLYCCNCPKLSNLVSELALCVHCTFMIIDSRISASAWNWRDCFWMVRRYYYVTLCKSTCCDL